MSRFLSRLFDTDFMPHVLCLRTTDVVWLHVLSDVLIAVAYLLIPISLLRLLKMRADIQFHWMFLLFAGFILSCGATHVLAVVTLWTPFYRFEGAIKAVTALLSLLTALLLVRLIPRIAELPSPAQYQQANQELTLEIADRRRAEERFRTVVESAPNAIVMIDRGGRIKLVNRLTEQSFGYSRDELLGQPVDMLLPERFRVLHSSHRLHFFARAEEAGPTVGPTAGSKERPMGLGHELYALRKDGSEFPIEVGLNPLQTEEGPMVLSAIVDSSERKRMETERKLMETHIREFNRLLERQVDERTEELRKANKELEEFAFVASHDLKAPLRVIDNCSKWIEEDLEHQFSADTRENMNLLRGRVRRMEKLLDDLLEYARIGRDPGYRGGEIVTGDAMMRNILSLISYQNFDITISPNFAALRVRVMPLQQVLFNLIGNAIKHHDKPHGRIEVAVDDCGARYAFSVTDDGPGIPAEFHEKVFKMFQTLRPRDQVEGSGMGLAMVSKHVAAFGGTVELESAEGQGSTFRFTWPKENFTQKGITELNGNAVLQAT